MRTCYRIDLYEYGKKKLVTKLITTYAAAQLAKSHDAPTGSANNTLFDSMDLLRAVKSRQVMSFFLENEAMTIGPPPIHYLQTKAASGDLVSLELWVMQHTVAKPATRVSVAMISLDGAIQSTIPIPGGYEINMDPVDASDPKEVDLNENEMALIAEMMERAAQKKAEAAKKAAKAREQEEESRREAMRASWRKVSEAAKKAGQPLEIIPWNDMAARMARLRQMSN